jgi:hypothetical protein
MKQHDPKQKEINGYTFHIRPFPAYTAINVSSELVAALSPAFAGIAPLAIAAKGGETDIMNANINVSSFGSVMAGLSGDKIESLLKKLLTKYGTIAVDIEEETKPLDDDLVNELFCGAAQDVFILAYEVIQVNFDGFFEKLGAQFGLQKLGTMIHST